MTLRTRAAGVAFRFDAILLRERGRYVMYMRSPVFQTQLPAGKRWVRMDLSKQTANLGVDLGSLFSAPRAYDAAADFQIDALSRSAPSWSAMTGTSSWGCAARCSRNHATARAMPSSSGTFGS